MGSQHPTGNQRDAKYGRGKGSVVLINQGGQKWIAGVNYIENLIRALSFLPAGEQVPIRLLFLEETDPQFYQHLDLPAAHTAWYTFRHDAKWKWKCEVSLKHALRGRRAINFEEQLSRWNASIIFPLQYSPAQAYPVPWIGWIPDFQHKHHPEFFTQEERTRRDRTFEGVVRDAAHVVVSSEAALQDLLRFYAADPGRVSVFPFPTISADSWFMDSPQAVAGSFGLPDKFLILPAQFWVHKNHATVFKAMRLLKMKGITEVALVCTGFPGDYRRPEHYAHLEKYIVDNDLKGNIRLLGLLPRQSQIQLMRRAAAVIQPSLFEGWSFLVEDCRALGKKIYVSDLAVHREQNPAVATFFEPLNAEQLAAQLAQDWARLTPGPDLHLERLTRDHQEDRALDFARRFLKIVQLSGRQPKSREL